MLLVVETLVAVIFVINLDWFQPPMLDRQDFYVMLVVMDKNLVHGHDFDIQLYNLLDDCFRPKSKLKSDNEMFKSNYDLIQTF